jgi:DNA-binding LacI/PurR family transcriptional regulator
MPVTIHEIAKAANVSIATVSRALNNAGHTVNQETKNRILAIANELGYQPNLAARNLRTEKSSVIGIIADDIVTPFTPAIIRGIQDFFYQAGYKCLITNTDWDPDKELAAIDEIMGYTQGIIFVESWSRSSNAKLDQANKKYVYVHRMFESRYLHSVVPDEIYGARLAVQHLISLGHQRIAFINGPERYYASVDRLKGYQMELELAGIQYDSALVERGEWDVATGNAAMQRILDRQEPLTAVFAANDLMALGAIHAIQDAGLRVPQDIAVVGYDDREIAELTRPSITTVSMPCYEMGETAAKMLLDLLIEHEEPLEEQKIRGELIIRESCGAGNVTVSNPNKTPRRKDWPMTGDS